MKALILSDLHHGHNNSEFFLNYELGLFDWFKGIIQFMQLDSVFILGDIHDKQMTVNTKVSNLFAKKHEELSGLVKNYVVLAGNHDCYYKTSNAITSLPLFVKNVATLVETEPFQLGNCFFIPWISPENAEKIKGFVSEHNSPDNYLFAHLEASGFKNGAITTKHDQLYVSDYGKYKKVFTGHYHAKQEKGNMLYVGNCFQKTFGELERKFVHVLDTDTGDIVEIENTNDIFRKVSVADKLESEEIREAVEGCKGKIVKLYIDSVDFDYINKVEMLMTEEQPERIDVKTKNFVESFEDVEIDNSTEEEMNKQFLETIEYSSKEEQETVMGKFNEFWGRI